MAAEATMNPTHLSSDKPASPEIHLVAAFVRGSVLFEGFDIVDTAPQTWHYSALVSGEHKQQGDAAYGPVCNLACQELIQEDDQ